MATQYQIMLSFAYLLSRLFLNFNTNLAIQVQ